MAKTDIPSKRLLQLRPEDWIKAALGTAETVRFREIKPDKIPKVESRLDSLYMIEDKNNRMILNIEPQGYYETALPARMLRYRSDIWEYTLNSGLGLISIKQVVVLFHPKHDNNLNILEDKRDDNSNTITGYDVLRVWEMDKDFVIGNKLLGLYSLLPLMKDERKETSKEIILKEAVEIALAVEDKALGADILAAMSFLAEVEYSTEIITKFIRRDMLMGSTLFNEWVKEERDEAAVKEVIRNTTEVLVTKFGVVDEDLLVKIRNIKSKTMLDQLFKQSLIISTVEEFEKMVDRAIK